jgi:hypothetical protein
MVSQSQARPAIATQAALSPTVAGLVNQHPDLACLPLVRSMHSRPYLGVPGPLAQRYSMRPESEPLYVPSILDMEKNGQNGKH